MPSLQTSVAVLIQQPLNSYRFVLDDEKTTKSGITYRTVSTTKGNATHGHILVDAIIAPGAIIEGTRYVAVGLPTNIAEKLVREAEATPLSPDADPLEGYHYYRGTVKVGGEYTVNSGVTPATGTSDLIALLDKLAKTKPKGDRRATVFGRVLLRTKVSPSNMFFLPEIAGINVMGVKSAVYPDVGRFDITVPSIASLLSSMNISEVSVASTEVDGETVTGQN